MGIMLSKSYQTSAVGRHMTVSKKLVHFYIYSQINATLFMKIPCIVFSGLI